MSRRWAVVLGLLALVAAFLAVNAVVIGNQRQSAATTIADGRILSLPGGDLQVKTDGPSGVPERRAGPPVVLLHCYTCSLHWYERIAPLLAERHRVVRVDLLGHGGSEKPGGGYAIPEQARLVAAALNELDVEGAVLVGNSMGAAVAVSVAEQASQLVDRVVDLDMAPNTRDYGGGLPFVAQLAYAPVLGPALWRLTPDFVLRDTLEKAFAPGFDTAEGFEDPDQPVTDLRAMTYTAYDEAGSAATEYLDEMPLDRRMVAAAVPLLVVFGAEDQLFDADRALAGFEDVPGVRTAKLEGVGHAPQVEAPEETASLIEEFSGDAGDASIPPPPREVGLDR